jgi:DNA-binding response OmpR family regulator
MPINILIVEDEKKSSVEIKSYLIKLGYSITGICDTTKDAYRQSINNKIDLILMSDRLIKNDGLLDALEIRKECNIPIIFLSAEMDENIIDKAIILDPIAYLVKPFNHKELAAAIKIALSHTHHEKHHILGNIPLDHEFSFDTKSEQLICCSEEVHLSKKERQLLELFLNNKNRLISFMTMEYELWADKPSNDSRRRTLISRLRAKLKHRFIETYASEGYIFKV